jgi:uncharacterized protein
VRALLGGMAAVTTRWPAAVLAGLAVATLGLGVLASTTTFEVDMAQLGSADSDVVRGMERIRTEFGDPGATVQVLVDAGAGRDVLTVDGFRTMAAVEALAVRALGPAVSLGPDGRPSVVSLRASVAGALAQQGLELAAAGEDELDAAVVRAVATNPQLAGLVSDDATVAASNAAEAAARGVLVVVQLDPELTESERTDAATRVQRAVVAVPVEDLGGAQITVFSSGLFTSGLLAAIRAEVPLLFGSALLVVLSILAVMYRSAFDVAIGFLGLITTVVWTLGLIGLLGPANLGLTGPLTQLAVIVPVLLVGLGVDYSVHLTARYREQRVSGQPPELAASRALHTVGSALVLATVATAIGFGSIATAPLPMLADFGVFVAVGVLSAFAVMGLLVPSARVLRDRRYGREGAALVRELGLGRSLAWSSSLAGARPWLGMGVAGALVAGSLVVATDLEVEFDRGDFIPEGSDVAAVLAHQNELFGGGVTEATFVVVDGDLADPGIARAVWESQAATGSLEGVRSVGGVPQVLSALTLATGVLESAGSSPGAGVPGERAELEASYERLRGALGAERVAQLLAPDASAAVVQIRTTVGDAGAQQLHREIQAAFQPVSDLGADVTVTSEAIIIAEMSDELAAFQLRAIGVTLAVVLLLLVGHAWVVRRRPLLGVIAMIPAAVSAGLVLATMWLLGISFNVLTATLTAIAVGIGVPYGVHVVNRFVEELDDASVEVALARTLHSTGGALAGSALTTLGAFVVLAFSGLPPIRSLGLLGGAAISFSLLAALLVQPGALVVWGRRQRGASGSDIRSASAEHTLTTGT